jgi:hypothetical protein
MPFCEDFRARRLSFKTRASALERELVPAAPEASACEPILVDIHVSYRYSMFKSHVIHLSTRLWVQTHPRIVASSGIIPEDHRLQAG